LGFLGPQKKISKALPPAAQLVAPQRGPVPAPPRPRKSPPVPAAKQLKRQAASQPGPTLAKPNGKAIIGGELGHARPVPPPPPQPLIAATQPPPSAAWPSTPKPPFKSAPTGKSTTTATTVEVSTLSIRGAGGFLPPQPHEIISLTKPIAVFETSGGKSAKAEVKAAAVEKANGERGGAVATTTSTEKAVRSTFVAALADNYLELENGLRSKKDEDRKKGGRATEAAPYIPRGDGGSKGGITSLKDKEQNNGGAFDYGDTIFMKEPTVGQLTLSTYEVAEATRRPPPQTNKEASLIALPLSAANKGAPLNALPLSAASTASGPVRLTSDIFVDYLEEEEEEGDGGGDSRETASPPLVLSSSLRPLIQPKRYQGSNARQQTPRPLPPAVLQTPRPLPAVRQWADTRASVEQQSGKA
jgi:hypothetical protein